MAIINKKISQAIATDNGIDTSYATNLQLSNAAAAAANTSNAANATIDTSYATNTGTGTTINNASGVSTVNSSEAANSALTASNSIDTSYKTNLSGTSNISSVDIGTPIMATIGTDGTVVTVDNSYKNNLASSLVPATGSNIVDTTNSDVAKEATENLETATVDTSKLTPADTSSTETDTTNTEEEDDTVMTYAEYLESIRDSSYQSAAAQKERSIVDANTSYKQNMASYGANAETLASMGLTGSGYSDYVNSQAYAQNRSDIQSANATYAAALQDADTSYASNMLDYMNTNAERYAALLQGANSGTYTASDVESLADTYGLSETQKNALIAAANTYEANKADEDQQTYYTNYATVLSSIDSSTTDEQISAYAKAYELSDEDIANLTAYRDKLKATADEEEAEATQTASNEAYKTISEAYAQGDFESYNPTVLDSYLSSGTITQETYDKAISDYTTNLYSQIEYAYKNGDTETLDSLLATLDKYYNNGNNNYGITTEAYQAVYGGQAEYIADLASKLTVEDDADSYISSISAAINDILSVANDSKISTEKATELFDKILLAAYGNAKSLGTNFIQIMAYAQYLYEKGYLSENTYKAFYPSTATTSHGSGGGVSFR